MILLLALILVGCSDTTVFIPENTQKAKDGVTVYIPVDPDQSTQPAPTEPPARTEPEETEPERKETATVSKKPTASSNKGTASDGKDDVVNKETVTGSAAPAGTQPTEEPTEAPTEKPGGHGQITGKDPVPTEPPATEAPGGSGQITATEPSVTEPEATEPPTEKPGGHGQITGKDPVPTEPPATEAPGGSGQITATEPPVTEPEATEPPTENPGGHDQITGKDPDSTEPPATEESGGNGQITGTEPPATEPPATEPPVTEPPATEPPLYDISDYVVGSLEYAILDRINEYRLEEGLEELYLDEYLCAIASYRGYEASRVWSHTRPDGRSYATVLDDNGYGAVAAGELLGYSTGSGAAVADKWMNSESHRDLLMGSSSTVGIGIYYAGGVIYVACLLVA